MSFVKALLFSFALALGYKESLVLLLHHTCSFLMTLCFTVIYLDWFSPPIPTEYRDR